jgi:hypothetical protein
LNNFEHYNYKTFIKNTINNIQIPNNTKILQIKNLLEELIKGKIEFSGDEYFYKTIEKIAMCYNKSKDRCEESDICVFTEGNVCSLILPQKNLLTSKENKDIYLLRISDELVRYSRIQNFMFNPNSYLSLGKINYNLNENELLIIQSLITQDFFENLEKYPKNKYVSYNSFFNATPLKTQKYNNEIDYEVVMGNAENDTTADQVAPNCDVNIRDKISSSIWKEYFPKSFKELVYNESHICTFKLIMDIIGQPKTIIDIKQDLLEEYKKYSDYSNKMIDILITEGKETDGKMILNNEITFENYLLSDNYYLTVFDLWLLIKKYNLSVVFLSYSKSLLKLHYTLLKENKFVANGNKDDQFIYIIVPTFVKNKIPSYSIIVDNENNMRHTLQEDMYHLFNPIHKKNIGDYLDNYVKYSVKKIFKRNVIIE